MVCLDVDGTLVNHEGHMSPAVKEAARAVVEAGHEIVVSTGRSLGATLPIVELLGIERGYAVCCNGGVTVRLDVSLPDGYEVVDASHVRSRPRAAGPAARPADRQVRAGGRRGQLPFHRTLPGRQLRRRGHRRHVRGDGQRHRGAASSCSSTDDTAEDFGEAVRAIGLHGVTYSVGWTAWLDIAAEGISKASGLELVRERLGDRDGAHGRRRRRAQRRRDAPVGAPRRRHGPGARRGQGRRRRGRGAVSTTTASRRCCAALL